MDPALTDSLPLPREHAEGKTVVYLNPGYEGEVNREDIFRLPDILATLLGSESRLPGRPTSWLWRPAWHRGLGLAVRQYAHGGLWGRLAGTLFLGPRRMLEEFRLSIYAQRQGLPVSTPVALRIERVRGPLVTAHLVSENISGALNLLEFFQTLGPGGALTAPQRRRLAAGIAAAIAAMHDAGILHGDLNLKNLLVRDAFDEPEVFIIDFDKATLAGRLSLRQRMANLLRLDRSVMKWAASRRLVSMSDRLRLLRSYLERHPQWRGQWRGIARKYGSRHLRHRFSREPD